LFVSLDANEEQLDFPVLYASGRSGWATKEIDGPRENLNPSFRYSIRKSSAKKI
jgi:GTP-binding protein